MRTKRNTILLTGCIFLGLACCSGDGGGGAGSPTAPSNFSISAAGITAVFHQDTVTITAQGCDSTVTWSAPEGAPSTGQGNTFAVFWWPGFGEQTATVTATCGSEQRSVDIDVLYRTGVCSGFIEIQVSQCSTKIDTVDGIRNGYDHDVAVTFRSFVRRNDGSIQVIGEEPTIVQGGLAVNHGGARISQRDGSTSCGGNVPGFTPFTEFCGKEADGLIFRFFRTDAGLVDFSAKLRPDQLFEGDEFRHQLTCLACD